MRKPLLLVLPLLLSACASMAPKYERPVAPVPATWPNGSAYGQPTATNTVTTPPADLPWQSFILDEKLRKVVDQALANSRDLRKTLATIESARAQYRVQQAAQLPTVQAGASGTRARSLSSNANGADVGIQTESYSATVGMSAFEIDLFGKQRSLTDAALESYLATEEGGRATRISLIAETSTAYLTLAVDQGKLALAQRTLESAERSMTVTRRRLEAGVASRVDVRQAETIYQQARSDMASLTTAIAQDRNALELLAGSAIDEALLPTPLSAETVWFADVPSGLSSDVLLKRPDVLQAEHTLKSANANIGAARAAFFPSLQLTAQGGTASTALSSLFTGGVNIWSVAPSLTLPIFDGGANRANLAYAKAQQHLTLAAYELAVQTAFREVADALARQGTIQEQLEAQDALVKASAESAMLAEARYQTGVDTFLTSLDSQRTLYSAEQTLLTTRLTALSNRVTVYRVLGGGSL